MFEEAGVEYPNENWTWDDFYEATKKLKKDDGSKWGYAINTGNNQDSYYNMIYDYGGYVINDDKTKSGYDDPKTIQAMKFVEKIAPMTVDKVNKNILDEINLGKKILKEKSEEDYDGEIRKTFKPKFPEPVIKKRKSIIFEK